MEKSTKKKVIAGVAGATVVGGVAGFVTYKRIKKGSKKRPVLVSDEIDKIVIIDEPKLEDKKNLKKKSK